MNEKLILAGYEYAKETYAAAGIDVEAAMKKADAIPVSMHCWQGDDVIGFDGADSLTGGIQTTGNYPGRARNVEELRKDIDFARTMIPGATKLNLHASYAEKNGKKVDRDAYTIAEFQGWADWAKENKLGLDFNPTYFGHPMMDGDLSLSSPKDANRKFWIEHGKRCREIGNEFAKQLGQPCAINYWMPDGMKDTIVGSRAFRERMVASLDEIFADKSISQKDVPCGLESKLFGIGVESFTVASHEFSMGYAIKNGLAYTLDAGHFHPTEVISAKMSAVLNFVDSTILHVSRPVRWDSDHVVALDDELQKIMDEIIFNDYQDRTFIGLDYFDASINRIACWAIGMSNARKALLNACLADYKTMQAAETEGDYTKRLAMLEERKSMPASAIWDYYCLTHNIPVGMDWYAQVKKYEEEVLSKR
ncbi:MAG: L-rhamnose isomerase [Clostridia bacterium]|nr:L-rhamnose isomerase [Clostridia bacterium]